MYLKVASERPLKALIWQFLFCLVKRKVVRDWLVIWDYYKAFQELLRAFKSQSQITDSNDGWAAFGHPPMVSMV